MLDEDQIIATILEDDGTFPNNQELPLLVYSNAIDLPSTNPAEAVERTFRENHWNGTWRNGIYSYHHYHSTAHEVLGVYRGQVTVQLGGPEGITMDASSGDVLILPAGTAHKNLGDRAQFACVGAYPEGQNWDMNYGKEGERPEVDRAIEKVSLPKADPVFGTDGPLMTHWFSS